MDLKVIVVVKIVVQEGKENSFLGLMKGLIEETRKESGCIRYDLV